MKKYTFIFTITIFIISCISHFIYNLIPNFFTSLFFPTNESIFEHIKLLYTSFAIYFTIYYIFSKDKNIITNFIISIIFEIFIYLIIYIPIYLKYGENFIFTISWLIITFILTAFISYNIKLKKINMNSISLILSILIFICMSYLTYNPPHNFLFIDPTTNTYGLNK